MEKWARRQGSTRSDQPSSVSCHLSSRLVPARDRLGSAPVRARGNWRRCLTTSARREARRRVPRRISSSATRGRQTLSARDYLEGQEALLIALVYMKCEMALLADAQRRRRRAAAAGSDVEARSSSTASSRVSFDRRLEPEARRESSAATCGCSSCWPREHASDCLRSSTATRRPSTRSLGPLGFIPL